MSLDEFLDPIQLAARLQIRERILLELVSSKQIPHRLIGKAIRFRWSEIVAWYETLPGSPSVVKNPAGADDEIRHDTPPDEASATSLTLVRGPRRRVSAGSGREPRR